MPKVRRNRTYSHDQEEERKDQEERERAAKLAREHSQRSSNKRSREESLLDHTYDDDNDEDKDDNIDNNNRNNDDSVASERDVRELVIKRQKTSDVSEKFFRSEALNIEGSFNLYSYNNADSETSFQGGVDPFKLLEDARAEAPEDLSPYLGVTNPADSKTIKKDSILFVLKPPATQSQGTQGLLVIRPDPIYTHSFHIDFLSVRDRQYLEWALESALSSIAEIQQNRLENVGLLRSDDFEVTIYFHLRKANSVEDYSATDIPKDLLTCLSEYEFQKEESCLFDSLTFQSILIFQRSRK